MPRPPAHHYHPLVRQVAKALRQRCAVPSGASIVVACSGGADSLALLHALALLAPRRKWRLQLIVAHIQHHLRDDAEDDARFVEQRAAQLGLPFARRDIHPGSAPGNVESNARDLRYQALADIAVEHGATFIATAHHADDQLETLLMRMLRGTSVTGLRGIAWHKLLGKKVSGTISVIRPMLAIDQRDIVGFLNQLDQPWREDTTNTDTTRTRAKLRHDILPQLKALQPDAANKARELAEHFGELHNLVNDAADHTLAQATDAAGDFALSRQQARALNRAVLTELLRRALIDRGVSADRLSRHALQPAVDAAQDHAGGERRFAFAKGVGLVVTREAVRLNI